VHAPGLARQAIAKWRLQLHKLLVQLLDVLNPDVATAGTAMVPRLVFRRGQPEVDLCRSTPDDEVPVLGKQPAVRETQPVTEEVGRALQVAAWKLRNGGVQEGGGHGLWAR